MLKEFIGVLSIVIIIIILVLTAQNFTVPNYAKNPNNNNALFQESNVSNNKDNSNNYIINIKQGSANRTVLEPFAPVGIKIKSNSTITWKNNDFMSHTVTSPTMKSGIIYPSGSNEGSSEFSYTFENKGIYNYFCRIHPYMGGVVYVDTDETEREIVDVTNKSIQNTFIEIPPNTAYNNHYGPFFMPANAKVSLGDKLTWINNDYIPHTATATDMSFDSRVIEAQGSFSFHISKEGVSTYYCKIHPWMQAIVTVSNNKEKH
jgi:plastocyanin